MNAGKARTLLLHSALLGTVFSAMSGLATEKADMIVARDGSGAFVTIQAALDAVPTDNQKDIVILIKRGNYDEKVYITKSHIALVGEDRDSTRIVYAELRENWNRDHQGSDWGSGIVNIDTGVTDITLANLTIYNNYGSLYGTNKHQFAVRGAGTRIMLLNCAVIADGGDTVSLWNRDDGMYYHADCYFEGWVDFVCPRGWCYVTHSRFFGHNTPSASIWHDGSKNKDQKFVIQDSYFDGVPGFPLGRNHLDAQFYLIDCQFSKNMANRPFYRPPSSPREWQWGARHYFYNCHRDSADFEWFKDNLSSAEHSPRAEDINARWTFDGKWDPEAAMPSVLPFAILPTPRQDAQGVDPAGVKLVWVPGRNSTSHRVHFGKTDSPELRSVQSACVFETVRLEPQSTYYWRIDEITDTGVIEGKVWRFVTR